MGLTEPAEILPLRALRKRRECAVGMRLIKVKWCSELVNIPGVRFCDYEKEFAFQTYCADWLRKQFVLTGNPKFEFWHHSANERQDARGGFRAKMMGQGKGWPDFVSPALRCAVELKVMSGVISPFQAKWLDHFRSIGWRAEVCWSFEEFRGVVLSL